MSKLKVWHKIRLIIISVTFITGCNDQAFQDLDLNPQAVNQIDLNFIFTPIPLQLSSGSRNGGLNNVSNLRYCSMVIQHLASSNINMQGDKYLHDTRTVDALFNFSYETLRNISEILRQTGPGGYDEGNKSNMKQVTRILRALMFQRLTDQYGNIPYFQAGQAIAQESILFPKYDHQSFIYPDLLKELDEATAALDVNGLDEGFSYVDFVYDGDITKWKKWDIPSCCV